MKIYMSYVMYLYEDTMYYEICVYGDIRVLCNMATWQTHMYYVIRLHEDIHVL